MLLLVSGNENSTDKIFSIKIIVESFFTQAMRALS